ncbi:beta-1,4-mannosyl-glycoprotein 4-beta-N-acetylglucosaminyltransferase isoform X1 [Erpetoichthys calabaricus]|nr:beta-1,4-mannosyl-glycoprotein 4-beta-N-acetylglucosaminyltransferase isoform X1 [Erpetoichthys calabaricus]
MITLTRVGVSSGSMRVFRMKMRRHRVFLLCTVGLCVISFLHYYKTLHYMSFVQGISASYPNIKSFIMGSSLFWKEGATPLSSVDPDEAPEVLRTPSYARMNMFAFSARPQQQPRADFLLNNKAMKEDNWIPDVNAPQADLNQESRGQQAHLFVHNQNQPHVNIPDFPENSRYADRNLNNHLNSVWSLETIHKQMFILQDKPNHDFIRTKAGALCFRQGTEIADRDGKVPPSQRSREDNMAMKDPRLRRAILAEGQEPPTRKLLFVEEEAGHAVAVPRLTTKLKRGKRLVKCVCRQGWHGPYCGVPTMVQHSTLPTKERLTPREIPRRVINAINVNHEFDLLHVRFHELGDIVDVFMICESNFTAYGDHRPLHFFERLKNGTYDYIRHKILYVFLNHFPEGGRQDGWIADDYLRTYLTRNGIQRIKGLRRDDVFVINDADEIPAREGIQFLKLFDGWTEPFAIHMRKSLYGFFWKQPGSLEVVSGCTTGMLNDVYENDGIKLRRREYYTMPGFRSYENNTGHILVQWSIGSPFHFAGWHCSWCFSPEGILFKLTSAQNGDFPRWGDYEDKKDLNYIRDLIRTGGWFDGTVQEYPLADPKEHMYAPKYLLNNFKKYQYMLLNPYRKDRGG